MNGDLPGQHALYGSSTIEYWKLAGEIIVPLTLGALTRAGAGAAFPWP